MHKPVDYPLTGIYWNINILIFMDYLQVQLCCVQVQFCQLESWLKQLLQCLLFQQQEQQACQHVVVLQQVTAKTEIICSSAFGYHHTYTLYSRQVTIIVPCMG